ncbi:histidine phosphatase superfamily [Chytridium lagenaria]|nr:histidine phosphatase superfamily [Chytridium lagenaria]
MSRSLYILRHGTRQDFISKEFVSPSGVGPHDPPLADEGHQQAHAVASSLITKFPNPPRITQILCSPFSRCIQTILPLSKLLNLPISIEPGLSEWFCANTTLRKDLQSRGLPPPPYPSLHAVSTGLNVPISSRDAKNRGGTLDGSYQPVSSNQTVWETDEEVHERFRRVVYDILGRTTGDLVLCSHAAGVISATRGAIGWSRAPILAGVATYVKLTLEPVATPVSNEAYRWNVETNGEAGHLETLGGVKFVWEYSAGFEGDKGVGFEGIVGVGPFLTDAEGKLVKAPLDLVNAIKL